MQKAGWLVTMIGTLARKEDGRQSSYVRQGADVVAAQVIYTVSIF